MAEFPPKVKVLLLVQEIMWTGLEGLDVTPSDLMSPRRGLAGPEVYLSGVWVPQIIALPLVI